MKGRDILVGAAIGLWLVMAFSGQHGQVRPATGPAASASSPSATVPAPARPLPERPPAAPQAGPGNSGEPGPLSLADFAAAIAISMSTVVITMVYVQAANRRRAT
jgi:hypothetical protein